MASGQGWYELDNAAKIIPSSVEGADTRVMRLMCELKEPVDPEILQEALDLTMPEFPHMKCCLKRGIFWYYLDEWKGTPTVMEENIHVLSSLYKSGHHSLLFRVMYYDKRITLEMFHALADGTGALVFLKHILAHYLCLKYDLDYGELPQQDVSSVAEKVQDAFGQFYEGKGQVEERDRKQRREHEKEEEEKNKSFIKEMFPTEAYQFPYEVDENLWQHVIEATVPTAKLVELAHDYHVTVGVLVTSLYIEAILRQMSSMEKEKPIVISVPVNLRKYFPSSTTRNFFGTIQVDFDPADYDGTLESILPDIKREFAEKLTEENVFKTMNSYASLEHNYAVKMTPLFMKYWGIRGYNNLYKRGVTTSVSNLGNMDLPEELSPYVEKFGSFMSARTTFMCLTSFGDKTVFGIGTCYTDHAVFMDLFRRMTSLGIPVEIDTNDHNREGEN